MLAIGYDDYPNRLSVPGEACRTSPHYYPTHMCYRQRVVDRRGKNSAAEAALELFRAGAHVTLVHRGRRWAESIRDWVKPTSRTGSPKARFLRASRPVSSRSPPRR